MTKQRESIKQSELKSLISEVIKECLSEVAPPGEKGERMVKHLKKSLTKTHPDWDEEKVKQVAYATAWKNINESVETDDSEEDESKETDSKEPQKKNTIPAGKLAKLNPNIVKGDKKYKLPTDVKEAGLTSEESEDTCEDHDYSEDEEIKLIKGLELICKKLISMHDKKSSKSDKS